MVIANQYSFVDNPAGNNLLLAAICGNLVLIAMANCRIMAFFTAAQQQDIRRELAHVVGMARYLQNW